MREFLFNGGIQNLFRNVRACSNDLRALHMLSGDRINHPF